MSTEEKTSLADDIGEVYDTLAEDEVVETEVENVEEVDEEEQETAVDEPVETEEAEEAEESSIEAADDEEGEAESEEDDIEPLAHWLKADKEQFKELPSTAKEFLVRRDKEFQRQATEKVNEVMHIKRALDPIKEEITQYGISDDQAVRSLVGAHVLLQKKPKEGIRALMERYRISPEELFSEDDSQDAGDPRVAALENKVTSYEQLMAAKEQAQLAGRIEEFKKNAEFFDDVTPEMTKLAYIERMNNPNVAPDIEKLYEEACQMNSAVRAELMRREAAGIGKAKSTMRSKNAAGTRVKTTPVAKKRKDDEESNRTLHDDISAAWDEVEEKLQGTAL